MSSPIAEQAPSRQGGPLPDWPRTAPPPLSGAVLRLEPEDFIVEEQLTLPDNRDEGEHLWVQIRKRGENTGHVADSIARGLGIAPAAVGYAGLKDRHALATQWISVHWPDRSTPQWEAFLPETITVLQVHRQARKLRPGMLHGNRFTIRLREASGDRDALKRRLLEIRERGVPHYFGEQRFGRGGDNLRKLHALLDGRLRRVKRRLRGLLISAGRSFLFNQVLAARVERGTWDLAQPGDAMVLQGSSSYFVPEVIDAEVRRRVAEVDIHPSGPLWGRGELPSRGRIAAIETDIAAREPELCAGLEREGLRQERRALRLPVPDLQAEWIDGDTLELRFMLARGGYATSVLREIATYRDAGCDLSST
jgi:tRNA pseudouridine13 synthase